MRLETRTAAILLATLVLGVVLGAVAGGAAAAARRNGIDRMRRPGGFVQHVEAVIQPRDEAQRQAIRPYLEATDRRNREIIRSADGQLRAELDSLRLRLAPRLDAEQRARLDRFLPPPPPFGGPGGRPPREGAGPPPDGQGPPPGEGRPPPDGQGPPPGGPPPRDQGPPPPQPR